MLEISHYYGGIMKKFYAICLVCSLLLLNLISCSYHYEKKGLDNFSANDSDYGICGDLIPPELIDKYNYEKGDYFFITKEKAPFIPEYDKCLLYLVYDDNTYSEAKKYTMEQLILSDQAVEVHNNYYFFENWTPAETGDTFLKDNFPHEFVRFAYNDTNNTLIFIGLFMPETSNKTTDQTSTDWSSFLEQYYGEWYDFSA